MPFVVGLFSRFFPQREVTPNPNIYTVYSVLGWDAGSGRRIVAYLRIENKILHQCQLKKRKNVLKSHYFSVFLMTHIEIYHCDYHT